YFDSKITVQSFAKDGATDSVVLAPGVTKVGKAEGEVKVTLPTLDHGYDTVDVKTLNSSGGKALVDKINTDLKIATPQTNGVSAVDSYATSEFSKPVVFTVDKLDAVSAKVSLVNVTETTDGRYSVT